MVRETVKKYGSDVWNTSQPYVNFITFISFAIIGLPNPPEPIGCTFAVAMVFSRAQLIIQHKSAGSGVSKNRGIAGNVLIGAGHVLFVGAGVIDGAHVNMDRYVLLPVARLGHTLWVGR